MKRLLLIFLMLIATYTAFGQGRGRGGRGAAPTGKPAAPFDPTGYWVSIVGEDWRWRMFPNKGDYGAAPLNAEARKRETLGRTDLLRALRGIQVQSADSRPSQREVTDD